MWLKRLFLHNFRNYENAHVNFAPGINVIEGENGQGKTNLLEAIYLLSTGRSFRTAFLNDLIRHDAPGFFLEAEFERDGIEQTLKISFDGQTRKVQHNATTYANFSNLLGLLPSVLFAPHDVNLISGAPADRRRFINLHIAQSDPLYVHHLLRFGKALKQRNCLLKAGSKDGIEVWEAEMALSALVLVHKRNEAIDKLQKRLSPLAKELSLEFDEFQLDYHPSIASDFEGQWAHMRKRELIVGSTQCGPHRDDLQIALHGKKAKSFSSEGQKRSCLAALRFAEWEVLRTRFEDKPLIGIDDFGVHLDSARSKQLRNRLGSFGQVFLTTPKDAHIQSDHTLTIADGVCLE